jgi:plasmid stabilization system protein ParE
LGSREEVSSPPGEVRIKISRSADRDLLAGFHFYQRQSPGVGHYFLDSLFADIDSLVLHAGIHRKIDGFHRLLRARFPFAVYYKIEEDVVRVRRVLDCRRDPSWISRQLKKG